MITNISIRMQLVIVWLLSIVGSIAILPYAHYMGIVSVQASYISLFFRTIINSAALYAVVCSLSYVLLKKVDLKPFDQSNSLRTGLTYGVLSGICVGSILILLTKTFFQNSLLAQSAFPVPISFGLAASIYGAINEEVQCRLFLLTFCYFILTYLFKNVISSRYLQWASIVTVALVFGVAHLPAAYALIVPSSFEIFRILFLNGIAGIVFGWLYCTKGFWVASAAHFCADIIIHVIYPILS